MFNNVTASIVLYNSDLKQIQEIVNKLSMLRCVYLIDNSPFNTLSELQNKKNVCYLFNNCNIGFGAGHNIAIKEAISIKSLYHFVINPDIIFEADVLAPMLNFMELNSDVGMLMPEILNYDSSPQFLPKLLPSPFSILMRKLKLPKVYYNSFINNYELRFVPKNRSYQTPIISGCFSLLNLNAISIVGAYDDRYFMYFEDWDLSRRMSYKFKTIFFSDVSVFHGYESGANKKIKLFMIYIKSAFLYFNKWGWIFDKDRSHINKQVLNQFK